MVELFGRLMGMEETDGRKEFITRPRKKRRGQDDQRNSGRKEFHKT
jgi:hypothetical protein